MGRKIVGAVVLAGALLLPWAAGAHEGHTHKALGTVVSIDAKQLVVKTTDDKTLTVLLDAKTAITRGKIKHDAGALEVGERVSVDYTEKNKVYTAKAIKLAELPAASKSAPKK